MKDIEELAANLIEDTDQDPVWESKVARVAGVLRKMWEEGRATASSSILAPPVLPFIQCGSCDSVINPSPEYLTCGGCGMAVHRVTGVASPFVMDAVMAPVVLGAQTVCRGCGGAELHRVGCERDFVSCDQCFCSHAPPACTVIHQPSEVIAGDFTPEDFL